MEIVNHISLVLVDIQGVKGSLLLLEIKMEVTPCLHPRDILQVLKGPRTVVNVPDVDFRNTFPPLVSQP
jgi:hypothetical protein